MYIYIYILHRLSGTPLYPHLNVEMGMQGVCDTLSLCRIVPASYSYSYIYIYIYICVYTQ